MRKHTPGPWSVCRFNDNYLIESSDGYAIGAAFDNNGWPINAENARLIAAAPELLEALEDALPLMGWSNMSDAEIQHEADEGNGTAPVIQKMRAAIAKAIGES